MKAAAGMLLLLLLALVPTSEQQQCPPGCFCDTKRAPHVPGSGHGTRVTCHQTSAESGAVFAGLPNDTVQLDMVNYGLTEVRKNMFNGLPFLQKLLLQGNVIAKIEDHSFRTLGHLQLLDLSR